MGRAGRTFYRLTGEGSALWSRRETVSLPANYRRILGLVDFCGHREVIRGQLARYPDHLVDGWLREFEALNLIEAVFCEPPSLCDLVGKTTPPPPLEEDDKERISADARFADISLSRLGVYVSHERAVNRRPSWKGPKFTVVLVVEDDPDQ